MLSLAKPAKRYGHVDDPPLDYGGGISNLHDTNLLRQLTPEIIVVELEGRHLNNKLNLCDWQI